MIDLFTVQIFFSVLRLLYFLLGKNILISILFSYTLGLCSSLRVTDQTLGAHNAQVIYFNFGGTR
jgi:hypothetical protein